MALPQNIIQELGEAFFLFDYDKDGKITPKEVGVSVRSVGLNPSEAELKEMCNDVNSAGGKIDVQGLCQIIQKRMKSFKMNPDELKDAFLVFDKLGSGMISVNDLKSSLTSLGEKLSPEELDELIREVDQDGEGMVNFQDMVRVLLA